MEWSSKFATENKGYKITLDTYIMRKAIYLLITFFIISCDVNDKISVETNQSLNGKWNVTRFQVNLDDLMQSSGDFHLLFKVNEDESGVMKSMMYDEIVAIEDYYIFNSGTYIMIDSNDLNNITLDGDKLKIEVETNDEEIYIIEAVREED